MGAERAWDATEKGVPIELPEIELPQLDIERSSENTFMKDLVEVSNIVRKCLLITASLVPTRPLDSTARAILMGFMVRVFKLYDSFMLLIVEQCGEIAFILNRSITESLINLKFLLRFGSDDIFRVYQKASLAYEKKLWDEIELRKLVPPLPIEERMQSSIKRTIERARFTLDDVQWEDRNWGGDLYSKAVKTDLVDLYQFGFRAASNYVHGTWHDLEFSHLIRDESNDYVPDPRYTPPRPQLIEGSTVYCLDVAAEYATYMVDEEVSKDLVEKLMQLATWFMEMQRRHELYLQARGGGK